ncbi:MAG: ATP-binding cassette domain-containing protein, partial [Perlabentimonas sp.]
KGVSFLYVTHKIEEVFEIADMVTVLRDGKKVGATLPIHELDRNTLVTLMVGRSENIEPFPVRDIQKRKPILEAKDLKSDLRSIKNSFTLYEGEILGWYGLVGAGRTELARLLIGYDQATEGSLYIKDRKVRIRSLSEALHQWGIGYLSENRKEEGLFLAHPIVRNIASSVWRNLQNRFKLLKKNAEEKLAEHYSNELTIRTPSIYQIVNALSGGNQQKVNFAKALAADPKILIVDEPTVGIDVKTKRQIHELIWKLSKEGISIIVITSDMVELIQLSDRILVFSEGSICGEFINTKDYGHMSKKIISLCLKEEGSAM